MEEENPDIDSEYSFLNHGIFAKSCQPSLNITSAYPVLLVMSFVFIGLAITLILTDSYTFKENIEYTDCISKEDSPKKCSELLKANKPCTCDVQFKLKSSISTGVNVYIHMDGMHQSHRMLAGSYDRHQLMSGEALSREPDSSCGEENTYDNDEPIAPCGALANSMFNDTLTMSGTNGDVQISKIDMVTDQEKALYKNPPGDDLVQAFTGFANPKSWRKSAAELDTSNPQNNGFLNGEFISWIRPFPYHFTLKLYGRITQNLPAGTYTLKITYNYPVYSFGGSKIVVFYSPSWLGVPSAAMGYIYLASGIVCFVFFVFFRICVPRNQLTL